MTTPFLSIILPAYNEERRLPVTLEQVAPFIRTLPFETEVLIIDNGSDDQTYNIAEKFVSEHDGFRVLRERKRGKGLAVKRGMLEACGEYRFMCDVDFSMPITEITRFLPPQLRNFDIAIASREVPGAVRYNEPPYRHYVGRVFNTFIRMIALPGIRDTQCGFKCFRGEVAEDLFCRLTLTGWSFDVELLFIANQLGYRVVELGIPWYFNPDSKVRVIRDSYRMGLDLFSIRLKHLKGIYTSNGGIYDK